MSINNLHSLLNGRWFIDEHYGQSLLPTLFTLLNGNQPLAVPSNKQPEAFVASATFGVVNASSFDASSNTDSYVAIIPLKDPITKYSQECGPRGTKAKQRTMESFRRDPNCAGVVLDIDSGGGQVSGTPEFHDYIKSYPKPVVSYTDGLMCSAAYYIGSAAKHIVANKRADDIGSIGTMINFIDFTGAYEKMGAKVITEYATKSTQKNKDFQDLLAGDSKGYIKNVLDPITDTFHEDMLGVRPGISKDVLEGGTYGADVSLAKGLIDEIGTLQTAVDKVMALSEEESQKQDTTQTQSHKSRSTMNKLNVPSIEAAIGAEFSEGETENGILLTDAQATALEGVLVQNAAALDAANTAATTAAGTISGLQTAAADTTTAVQNALVAAGVEGAETMSNEEGINALSALVAEYGGEDGGKPTNILNNGEETEEETNLNVVGGLDISAAMNY
ncbi:hypothetical protein HCG49_16980 [Arenibacter sp. 6A1]|uniref:S49 family peptidase n=1 Tax=Arenibacter sp. 6A1 TaxID=2720391 RepID=UPI001446D5A9|nr:S49 family peptidase [Arenibacter sp. 6A1]NKI28250.1 hypothetical protein [Arenibacter sp. 6A1]